METADELNKKFEQKLDELEKRVIIKEKENVSGKKTTFSFNCNLHNHWLNHRIK